MPIFENMSKNNNAYKIYNINSIDIRKKNRMTNINGIIKKECL